MHLFVFQHKAQRSRPVSECDLTLPSHSNYSSVLVMEKEIDWNLNSELFELTIQTTSHIKPHIYTLIESVHVKHSQPPPIYSYLWVTDGDPGKNQQSQEQHGNSQPGISQPGNLSPTICRCVKLPKCFVFRYRTMFCLLVTLNYIKPKVDLNLRIMLEFDGEVEREKF